MFNNTNLDVEMTCMSMIQGLDRRLHPTDSNTNNSRVGYYNNIKYE